MNRYVRAARIGYENHRGSPFNDVPNWLRFSNACRAAFEIGAYLKRCDAPAPDALEHIGGRKAPAFLLSDGRKLAVWSEYPGVRIKPA